MVRSITARLGISLGILEQDVVHRRDEFLDGSLGFVAHVGNAECGTLDFAVAAVDQEVVLGFQVFDETGEVEICRSFKACQRKRPAAFWGKSLESVFGTPSGDHRIGRRVAELACGEALLGDFSEDVLQAVNDRNGRGGRGVIHGGVLGELDEIEVVTALRIALGAFHGCLGNCENGEAGR
jgi:hypothetical protein